MFQIPSEYVRELVKLLGNIGEIEAETEGMLAEYEVDSSDFLSNVLECLPKIDETSPWTIPKVWFMKNTMVSN